MYIASIANVVGYGSSTQPTAYEETIRVMDAIQEFNIGKKKVESRCPMVQ